MVQFFPPIIFYQLSGKKVNVRYTAKTVEIFSLGNRVASHKKSYIQYRATTVKEHMPKEHQKYLEWTPSRIINWAASVGNSCADAVEKIISSKEHPAQGYRSCLGILRLGKTYSNDRLEAACKRALAINGCSYQSIKSILKNGLDRQPVPRSNISIAQIEHENIRGGEYYD